MRRIGSNHRTGIKEYEDSLFAQFFFPTDKFIEIICMFKKRTNI